MSGKRSGDRRPAAVRTAGLVLLVLFVFCASLITVSGGRLNLSIYRIDLNVYRLGADAWMHAAALYGPLPLTRNGLSLGFTYPPISAVAMTPLALVPFRVAAMMITATTIGLLLAVMALFLRAAGQSGTRAPWRLASALLPLAVLIEPVRTNLAYGQINVVLMALVGFDCLVPDGPRAGWAQLKIGRLRLTWPRGALVGVAAAIKLTPAVYLMYFVGRRDWRAAATTVVAFAATTGLGFLLAGRDSVTYWTQTVFNTGRIGPIAFSGNQSVNAVLYRAHLTGSTETAVWLTSVTLIGLLALAGIVRAARAGRPLTALALTACTEQLVSPVSWSHHWVWAAPVLLTAAVTSYHDRDFRILALCAALIAVFVAGPEFWFPHTQGRELRWGWWEQVIGSSYVWIALAAVVYFGYPEVVRLLRDGWRVRPVELAPQPEAAHSLEPR